MKLANLKWIALAQTSALLVLGCSGGDDGKNGTSALVRIDEVAAGDDCAEGGYSVATGADTNGDGTLGDDEVQSTQFVCNGPRGMTGMQGGTGDTGDTGDTGADGADGFAALTSQRKLVVGDATCEYGGLEISAGVDNGDGDSTAGDGTLQAGEVDDVQAICESRPAIAVQPFTPPEGPEGQYTIRTGGGTGSTSVGGEGGDFDAEMDYGSFGGHIKLFNTGVVDASFDVPEVQAYLGNEPLTVSDDLTIVNRPADDHTGLVAGDAHTHASNTGLFIWNGTTDDTVTGLEIAAGATVTLEQNFASQARIYLANDFHNAGTVTTTALGDGRSRANLRVDCDVFIGAEGSRINLAGLNGTSGNPGGNGGSLDVNADDDDLPTNEPAGAVYNFGTIDTSGGNGDTGGSGGDVDLYGYLRVINTGEIDSTGGTGSVTSGGSGGDIYIDSSYGHVLNSADMTSSGGDGETTGGGAGYIYLYIGYPGDIRNSGNLTARGGSADADCTVGCSGGSGDYVQFYVYSGGIYSSGNVDTRGGSGAAGPGGSGGWFYATGAGYDSGWESDYQEVGSIHLSGNIDLRGGNGSTGGSGGSVDVDIDAGYTPDNQEIVFYGYTDVDTSGGDGFTGGGPGGYFGLYQNYSYADFLYYGPSGGCINYANLNLRGGDATDSGTGGDGGYVELETDYDYGYSTSGEVVLNYGDIDNSGGNGEEGGDPGYVYFFAYNAMENHGDITSRGGNASNEAAAAGSSTNNNPHVQLTCDGGPLVNSGTIDISGGSIEGAATAGDAGLIELYGASVESTGDLIANGGAAPDANSTGGVGGYVFVYGWESGTSHDADIQVSGGDGATDGENGEVFIDSVNVTGDYL